MGLTKKSQLVQSWLFCYICVVQASNNQSKGRNSDLIFQRNQKLAARFYWYSCLIGFKFSKCLGFLEKEFDLSQSRICDLLTENADLIGNYEYKKIDVTILKDKYPFFNWSLPAMKSPNAVQLSLNLF